MLTAVFRGVLGTSLSVLPVLALLFPLRPVLSRRYSPGLWYSLWLLVAARLLAPVSLPDIARFLVPAGEAVYLLESDSTAVLKALAEAEAAFGGAGAAAQAAAGPGAGALSLMTILAAVWLAGAALFLGAQLAAYLLSARRLRRWCVPVADKRTRALFDSLRAELGIRRDVGLCRCALVPAPMLMGFVSPRVLLPAADGGGQCLREVLCHELTHLRRRDLWYKLAMLAARALHWFNPGVHLLAKQAENDMELCCDRDVLAKADAAARRLYGYAVLSYAGRAQGKSKPGITPLATCFRSGRRQTKQRMLEIMDTKNKKRGLLPLCAAVAAVLLSAALISCGSGPVEKPPRDAAGAPELSTADSAGENPAGRLQGEQDAFAARTQPPEDSPVPEEQDIAGLEAAYLADLEKNKALQEKALAELQELYESIDYPDQTYTGGEMWWPLPGCYSILSVYGPRFGGSDFHTGMDISGGDEDCLGAPVTAAQEGTVAFVNTAYTEDVGYGIYLILDHGGGISTLYAHLSAVDVKAGDTVEQGQVIGKAGFTGWSAEPHLHFEVREEGKHVEPASYLKAQ